MMRAVFGAFLAMTAMAAGVVRVLQSNAAGDNIHVIDPATNEVVAVIEDVEVPHGVAVAPDGSRIYVSDEALKTLDVVDARTLKVFQRIPLSGRPNNVAVGNDGAHVYVGIRAAARGGRCHPYRDPH
jgi:YVTN family beta-propeller protein